MSEQRARANGIEIAYETIGDPSDQPLLLIMGLGMQMIHWDRELCDEFAERGFYVIRFDNRDSGHSTSVPAPVPPLPRALAGLRVKTPYLLADMAQDAVGLLDHLAIERAHVMGASMGGMIAQQLAIDRPERVLSLTSIMASTGARRVGLPRMRGWMVLLRRPPNGREAYIEHFVRVMRLIGSRRFETDEERLREAADAAYERGVNPAGTARQFAAILASGDRTQRLRELAVPTLVVHGTDDPLVPFRGGLATARAVRDSELVAIPGMGHDLPPQVWPKLIDAFVAHAERALEKQTVG